MSAVAISICVWGVCDSVVSKEGAPFEILMLNVNASIEDISPQVGLCRLLIQIVGVTGLPVRDECETPGGARLSDNAGLMEAGDNYELNCDDL